jgi:hypothetical protein
MTKLLPLGLVLLLAGCTTLGTTKPTLTTKPANNLVLDEVDMPFWTQTTSAPSQPDAPGLTSGWYTVFAKPDQGLQASSFAFVFNTAENATHYYTTSENTLNTDAQRGASPHKGDASAFWEGPSGSGQILLMRESNVVWKLHQYRADTNDRWGHNLPELADYVLEKL